MEDVTSIRNRPLEEPRDTMASADQVAQALLVLNRNEVPGVHDVRPARDGTMDVVFTEAPSDVVVARVRELLAPAEVTAVWYEGEISADLSDIDMPADEDQHDREDDTAPCGVCQAWPAPWRHSTTPSGAAVASAATWHLCDVCHELVNQDTDALAARMTIPDMDHTQLLDLAGRIH